MKTDAGSELNSQDVHLWFADLDRRDGDSRTFLRTVLGRYIGKDPSSIRFRYGSHGKPDLDEPHRTDLRFNLSHSGGRAIVGLTRSGRIGVDIEWIDRSTSDLDRIARRFFSANEYATIRATPDSQKRDAFFTIWTLKEALLKARGDGLSTPLNQFEVAFGPGETARLVRTDWDPGDATRWSLSHITPDEGYIAAIAVEGRCGAITSFRDE